MGTMNHDGHKEEQCCNKLVIEKHRVLCVAFVHIVLHNYIYM